MIFKHLFTISAWWGKVIGAFLGYITAGPVGAFIGLLVGNFFDKGLISHFTDPHYLFHSERKSAVQKIFFEATFAVMGHIAKADGRVSSQEIKMAKALMQEMRLTNKQKEVAKKMFNEGKEPTFRLDILLRELKWTCKDNRELLKLFADIQYRTAMADGLSVNKIKALDAIFSQLGFAPLHKQYRFFEDFGTFNYEEPPKARSNQSQQNRQYQRPSYAQNRASTLDQAFALLEINPTASKLEAKRAYRRLLSKNHPDKLIAQGLPESMIKIANEKTDKIVKAFEYICQSKGWK